MTNLARRIAALSPAKRALLEQQLKKKRDAFHFLPLSPAQQRLWFLDQLEPGNPSYNILTALRLRGRLHVAMLERALNTIVQRHEILRTSFSLRGKGPVQVIAPLLNLALPVIDLGAFQGEIEREAEVRRQAGIETRYIFNLAETPLIRTSLLRLDEDEHVLLINMHHIISDGWSFAVLVQELEALYTAFVEGADAGERVPLPELPIQYGDYAVWQREWLEGRQKDGEQINKGETPLKQQLEYWKRQLQGAPGVLELPADHPRPAVQTYQGASETLMLDSSLARGLKSLGQQSTDEAEGEKYTLFMALLAVFQILLSRYTGEEDVVVGSPFANRNRVEVEKLIGFFVNTLVLRTDLSHDPTFRELLKRVRRVCLEAHANQDIPFDNLIEELKPERDLSRTPLFQVFFNLLNIVNYPMRPLDWPGLSVEVYWPHQAGVKFDLTLYAQELDEGIRLEALYNADLFERSRIREMLAQMKYLVEQVIAHPDACISQYSLVTPEAALLLPDPGEPLSATWPGSVFSLFAEHAQMAPEHPALVDADGVWSYRDLNEHSNRLANYLLAQGIGSQAVVAIYARRATSLVWALFGVLKTGAAYMILDPSYPAARLSEYLRLARVSGFLQLAETEELSSEVEDTLAALPLRCRIQLPLRPLASPSNQFAHSSPADPGVVVGPNDIACVAFTSGSTGHPRGILQRHGSLTHFFPWQQQTFGLSAQDRYSMLSGLSHDPLQRDIFTSLCLGATLCIPTQEDITTPGHLAMWMRQACISITHLTPAMLHLLTQSLPSPLAQHEIPSLRCAFIVGDVLTKLDIKNLQQIAPAVTCISLYGSTESQRAVGYFVIPPAPNAILTEQEAREIIPLGRGCKDVQLLILNHSQQLAGIGEIGEIAIRSPHLAQGYLANDELTRERFIPNSFTHAANDRLYKTGDLGRYAPDGNVEHAGRGDLQVKLRGFRIELAEIEATLLLHPAVREAAVVTREDDSGDKSLIAYVVPVETPAESTFLEHTLWQFLRTYLPGYMLPAAFTFLEALPLSPNHKVDRHALQALARTSRSRVIDDAGPRTPEEEILVDLWKQILNVEHVGVDENFFELGGHSLLGVQFLARVNEIFHTTLRLRTLFEAPTVASFAAALTQQTESEIPAGTRQPALVPLARPTRSVKPLSSHRDGAVSENKE